MFVPVWLIQNTIIVTAIFPAVYLICRLLRRNPAVQNGLWLVLLVKLILPPVLTWPIVAPSVTWNPSPSFAENSVPAPQPDLTSFEAMSEDRESQITSDRRSPPVPDHRSALFSFRLTDVYSTGLTILEIAWIIGSAVTLILLGQRIYATRMLLKGAVPGSAALQAAVDKFIKETGRKVDVAISTDVDSPSVVVIGSATILWPQKLDLDSVSPDLESLLAHEFAHVMRRDHWVKWLEYACTVIHWWNPIHWLVCHQLHETREEACDARALQMTGIAPGQYANRLLELVTGIGRNGDSKPACALSARPYRSIERRLKMIFETKVTGSVSRPYVVAMLPFVMALIPTWPLLEQKAAVGADTTATTDLVEPKEDQQAETKTDDAKDQSDSKGDSPVVRAEKPKPVWSHGMLIVFMNDEALKEIGIAKDSPQFSRIREISGKFGSEFQRRAHTPTDEDREQRLTGTDLYGKVETEYVEQLKQVIEPEQYKRLREIFVRWQGVAVILVDDFAVELKLTEEQRQTLRTIKSEFDSNVATLRAEKQQRREANENSDDVDKRIRDQEPLRLAKYETVLTPGQRARFSELQGTPFEWKDNPQRPLPVNRNPGMPIRIAALDVELLELALRPPVLEELGIAPDSDLIAKLRKEIETRQSQFRDAMTNARKSANPDVPFDSYKVTEELARISLPQVEKLLTTEKFTRLKQIRWQFRGFKNVDQDSELSKALEITEDQKSKLQALRLSHFRRLNQLQNPPGGQVVGTPVSDEALAKSNELLEEWEAKSREVFDESQRERFQNLTGKLFDVKKLRRDRN